MLPADRGEFSPETAGSLADHYKFRLYVAGNNLNSILAIRNMRRICRTVLKGRSEYEVIDLYQQPELAARDRIVVAPTLVKSHPLPKQILVGDLSQLGQVLRGIGIPLPETGNGKTTRQKGS